MERNNTKHQKKREIKNAPTPPPSQGHEPQLHAARSTISGPTQRQKEKAEKRSALDEYSSSGRPNQTTDQTEKSCSPRSREEKVTPSNIPCSSLHPSSHFPTPSENNFFNDFKEEKHDNTEKIFRGGINKHHYTVEEGFVAGWIYCLAGIHFHRKSRK